MGRAHKGTKTGSPIREKGSQKLLIFSLPNRILPRTLNGQPRIYVLLVLPKALKL